MIDDTEDATELTTEATELISGPSLCLEMAEDGKDATELIAEAMLC